VQEIKKNENKTKFLEKQQNTKCRISRNKTTNQHNTRNILEHNETTTKKVELLKK
jgi:hypothetical protein